MLFKTMHIVHLLTVIVWIGGLAFITILLLPMVVKMQDALQKVLLFQRIEHRFAPMARVFCLIVGITGVVMVKLAGWQTLYFTRQGLPLLFMTVIWVLWFVMPFGLEPLIVKKMLDTAERTVVFSLPVKWHLLTPQRIIRYKIRRCPVRFYTVSQIDELMNQEEYQSFIDTEE